MTKRIGNIYWRDALNSRHRVTLQPNSTYTCNGLVVYWYGKEKTEAHHRLDLASSTSARQHARKADTVE